MVLSAERKKVQNAELKDKIVGEGFSLPQINDKEKRAFKERPYDLEMNIIKLVEYP